MVDAYFVRDDHKTIGKGVYTLDFNIFGSKVITFMNKARQQAPEAGPISWDAETEGYTAMNYQVAQVMASREHKYQSLDVKRNNFTEWFGTLNAVEHRQ